MPTANSGAFRVIAGVPILDAHDPILKTKYDPAMVSADNPDGSEPVHLGADEDTLRTMADNCNARVASGRPPTVQLGHTQHNADDLPESELPKQVGHMDKFRVEDRDGRPHLVGDMAIRAEHYAEASTYPRCSIERVLGDSPEEQHIPAVALLRRDPERDLPIIPYARQPAGDPLADKQYRKRVVEFATSHGITRWSEAVERYTEEAARVNYDARQARGRRQIVHGEGYRKAMLSWATSRGITDPTVMHREFARVAPGLGFVESVPVVRLTYAAASPSRAPRNGPGSRAYRAALVDYAVKHNLTDIRHARAEFAKVAPSLGLSNR